MVFPKKVGFEFTALMIILASVAFSGFILYSTESSYTASGGIGYPTFRPSSNSTQEAGYDGFTQFGQNSTANTTLFDTFTNRVLETGTSVTGLVGVVGVILGTTVFPNPYLIFGGFFIFLIGLIDLPSAVLTFGKGVPAEFSSFFVILFVIIMGMTIVSWWKGNSGAP